MNINLIYQQKVIYEFTIENDILNNVDKETIIVLYIKKILDNFEFRINKRLSLTFFTFKVIDETIKYYENSEEYEKCAILKLIKNILSDIENRTLLFNNLINELNSTNINEK